MSDDHETVEVSRRALSVLANSANTYTETPHWGAVREALEEAHELLNWDLRIVSDCSDRIEQVYDTVSVTLDTDREVTTHSAFGARNRKGPWNDGVDLHLTIIDDDLDALLYKATCPALSEVSVGDTVRFEVDDASHDYDTVIARGEVLEFEYGEAIVRQEPDGNQVALEQGEIIEVVNDS